MRGLLFAFVVVASVAAALEAPVMCGSYSIECRNVEDNSIKNEIILKGERHQNPFFMEIQESLFAHDNCAATERIYTTHGILSIDSEKEMTYKDYQFSFSEAGIEEFTCTPEGVKPEAFYSMKHYVCVDKEGADPFEELRKLIDQTVSKSVIYTDDSSAIEVDEVTYPRVAEEGCRAVPTEVPTVEPTEVPTVEPTVEPTEVPTVVPTVVPTEVPTPTPTVPPTEAPAPSPSYTAWFWTGGILIVIGIGIIMVIVHKKNQAEKASAEAQPLV